MKISLRNIYILAFLSMIIGTAGCNEDEGLFQTDHPVTPTIEMGVSEDTVVIEVGESVAFTPTVNANSTNLSYGWFLSGDSLASIKDYTFKAPAPGVFTLVFVALDGDNHMIANEDIIINVPFRGFRPKAYNKKVVGYFPVDGKVEGIQWDKITHLVVTKVFMDITNGALKSETVDGFIDDLEAKGFNEGVAVSISIGSVLDWGAWPPGRPFTTYVTDAANRATAIKNVLTYAEDHKLQGIDIDWGELQGGATNDAASVPTLLAFFSELEAAMNPEKFLTATIPGGAWGAAAYNNDMLKDLDWVHVAAYDYTGTWSGAAVSNHSTKADATAGTIRLVDEIGLTAEQIVMGIPLYGYQYTEAKVTVGTGAGVRVSFADIIGTYSGDKNADEVADGAGKLFYNGHTTVNEKLTYVTEKNLGGVVLHKIGEDHTDASINIQTLIHDKFNK